MSIVNDAGIQGTGGDEELKDIFLEALPLIARVAGGEAVLFNRQGMRIASLGPDGKEIKGRGEYTPLGHKAMQTRRPVIGPSLLEDGATAVRIPITENLGLGFNNFLAMKQRRSLIDSEIKYARYRFEDIKGESGAIQHLKDRARRVAASNSTVLIYGETGTGKELFAQAIHNESGRSGGPFIALNCGAIPATLTESLLFGYVGGAFTGARKEGHPGLFEQAEGGSLFLDDISEMPLNLQPRLLRVLQEHEIVRVGGKRHINVDVRVIASTNRDLMQMVLRGQFRQDLYYRLNVVDFKLPPLRERTEDIPLLSRHFIEEFKQKMGSPIKGISERAVQTLQSYSWPGNVRELHSAIERAMNLATGEALRLEDIDLPVRRNYRESEDAGSDDGTLEETLLRAQRHTILHALEISGHNRRHAADRLGISTVTLWRKMKRLRITSHDR